MNKAVWRSPELYHYWLPPLLCCAAILLFSGDLGASRNTLGLMRWLLSLVSSLTPTQIKVIHFYLRKTAHVMTYGVLYFLWFRAFQGHLGYSVRKSFFWSLGLSLLISALDEGHQSLFRTRGGKIEDVGLDLSAALLAAWLTAVFWQRPFRLQPASGQGAARHSGEME